MATEAEVQHAFKIVLGAGLDYPPRADEITTRVDSWCELLTDVPGECLIQAAKDIALSGDRFPSVAAVRKQARDVMQHQGRAKPTPFDVMESARRVRFSLPVAYWQEHDRLRRKCSNGETLPTDEELYHLEKLSNRVTP